MLTEIALTPHTFQPCSIDPKAWAFQLRALIQRLMYHGNQCPLIISNLNQRSPHRTPEWRAEIARLLSSVKGNHAQLLSDLIEQLSPHLVPRPSCGRVRIPADEQHWVHEAISPAPSHSIDHIVVTFAGQHPAQAICPHRICINRLDQEVFWGSLACSVFPPMSISAQVEVLRPIWLHGQVLVVVLPYGLDTSPTGEASWFFEFAARAFGRPANHGEPVIELHVSFEGNGADMQSQAATHPIVADFISEARRQRALQGHSFRLFVRARSHGSQRYIARRIFAGEEANVGTGIPAVGVRWGIMLEHVAHPRDSPNQTPPTFTLLPRTQAEAQFQSECRNLAPRLCGPIVVHC